MNRELLLTPVDGARSEGRAQFEAVHLLSLGLFLTFLGTGVAKIASTAFVLSTFATWAAPAWMLVAIGVIEVSAAVLTVIPTTRLIGAGLIATVMAGAMAYHAAMGELLQIAIPATAASLALLVMRLELSLRRAELEPQPADVRAS